MVGPVQKSFMRSVEGPQASSPPEPLIRGALQGAVWLSEMTDDVLASDDERRRELDLLECELRDLSREAHVYFATCSPRLLLPKGESGFAQLNPSFQKRLDAMWWRRQREIAQQAAERAICLLGLMIELLETKTCHPTPKWHGTARRVAITCVRAGKSWEGLHKKGRLRNENQNVGSVLSRQAKRQVAMIRQICRV